MRDHHEPHSMNNINQQPRLRLVGNDDDAKFRTPPATHVPSKSAPSTTPRPWRSITPPSSDEIAQAVDPMKFPPILNPGQAANLLQMSKNTLYKAVSQGKYKSAVRRGKPLRFWRDRLIQAFFAA